MKNLTTQFNVSLNDNLVTQLNAISSEMNLKPSQLIRELIHNNYIELLEQKIE